MEKDEEKIYEMLGNIYRKGSVDNLMYSNSGLREALITLSENFNSTIDHAVEETRCCAN